MFTRIITLIVFGSGFTMQAELPANVTSSSTNELRFILTAEDGVPQETILTTNRLEVANSATIAIEHHISGGNLFYTLDGSEPTVGSTLYDGPIDLTNSATIRAAAYDSTFSRSITGQLSVVVVPTVTLSFSELPSTNLIVVSPSGSRFQLNTVVNLTALDQDGWVFDRWTGDLSGTNRTVSLLMDTNKTVGARYVTRVNTAATPEVAGEIRVTPDWVGFEEVATLTAIPADGYFFAAWGGSITGSENPAALRIIDSTQFVSAAFAPLQADQATLTVLTDIPGIVAISPKKNVYMKGETVTLTIDLTAWRSEFGLRFNGWEGDASGFDNPLVLTIHSSKVVHAQLDQVHAGERPTWESDPFSGTLGSDLPAIGNNGTVYSSTRFTLVSAKPDLQTNWVLETGLSDHSEPALGESGTIYVAGANGDAVAVNPDGAILWRFTSGDPAPVPSGDHLWLRPHPILLALDETLYITSSTSYNVYIVKNGELLRSVLPLPNELPRCRNCPPFARTPIGGPDGTVYFPLVGGFSAQSPGGREKWTASYPRPSAIDAAGRLYSISGADIVAIDFAGDHLWTTSLSVPVYQILLGEGGRIFARSQLGITAFETNGTPLWTNSTLGNFVPLADGGVLVAFATGGGVGESVHRIYQRVTSEGINGPFNAFEVGLSMRSINPTTLVVSDSGDVYSEWQIGSLGDFMEHTTGDTPLARSSWPRPWGRKNTGRATAPPAGPSLSIERDVSELILRSAGTTAPVILESSTNLEHWTEVEQFDFDFSTRVQPDSQRYYRLRQD